MFGFLTDIFNANSAEDQRKRLARGGKRFYDEDERAKGNKAPASNPLEKARNLAVDTGRAMARAPETALRSMAESAETTFDWLTGDTRPKEINKSMSFNDPIRKALYGSEPIETYGTRREGYQKTLSESRFRDVAGPLSFLGIGLTAATDPVLGAGGAGKGLGKSVLKELAKESTEQGVKKILLKNAGHLGEEVINKMAPNIALAKDSNVVKNIIKSRGVNEIATSAGKTLNEAQQQVIKDHADLLKSIDAQSTEGGKLVGNADIGYKRTSDHSQFYSKYYAANKRAPSNRAWLEESERQLKEGTGYPEAVKAYHDAGNPELQSLAGTAEQATAKQPAFGIVEDVKTPPAEPMLGTGRTKEKGFAKTLKASENTNPELKQALESSDTTYKQLGNAESLAKGQEIADANPEEVWAKIMSNETMGAEDVSSGFMLMRHYSKIGDFTKEKTLADRMIDRATQAGQHNQAYAIWDRLSPEGKKLSIIKSVKKTRESKKFASKLAKEESKANEIKNIVENAGKLNKSHIDDTIKEIADEPITAQEVGDVYSDAVKDTAQKVAKGVAKKVTPQAKKKVNELAQELVKKVDQDILMTAKTGVKKSPIDRLQEVFGKSDIANEAYPMAQKILQKRYANKPDVLEALDKFFASKLDIPAASSTIDSAIKEQLKTNGVKISDIIYKSIAEQGGTVVSVTNDLVKNGFDKASAEVLANKVMQKLSTKVKEAKISQLEGMSKRALGRAQTTYLEKIAKMSNLGALDSADYISLARKELKLPELTEAMSKKISELAQKMQALPEGAERSSIEADIQRIATQAVPLTTMDKVSKVLSMPRAIMASVDLSFGGRQGLVYMTTHPIKWAEAWPAQFKNWSEGFTKSEPRAFYDMMAQIKTHKYYDYLKRSGVALIDIEGNMAKLRDEQFIGSDWAEKIPGLGRAIRGSNYAYAGMGNTLRANEFYSQIDALIKSGTKIDDNILKDLGEVINTATGRGSLGKFENAAGALSTVLFSPRLMVSRLQMFNPQYYMKLSAPARKEAVKNAVGLTVFTLGVLGIAKLAGLEVGDDPRSSNFGKIKIGDTRIDFTGGYSQYIRFMAQMITGQQVSSTTGKTSQLGKGITRSRLESLYSFLESKENPTVSFVSTMLRGKDISGNPVDLQHPRAIGKEGLLRVIPLIGQDVADLITHKDSLGHRAGGLGTLLGGGLAVSGIGMQTYGEQDLPVSENQQKELAIMKKKGSSKEDINAAKSFYQRLKVSSSTKESVSSKMNKALEKGDREQYLKLAKDYNEILKKTMKEWADKNPEMSKDKSLLKLYNTKKISLTKTSMNARLRAIHNNPDTRLRNL